MIEVYHLSTKGAFHFLNTEINYDECWIYVGPAYWANDYPVINKCGKNWIASRYAWFIVTGRDYHGKEIHHVCEIKTCVNPFHLEELRARKHRRFHNERRKNK